MSITNRYTDRVLFEAATLASVGGDFEGCAPGFFANGATYGFDGFSLTATLNADHVGVRSMSSGDFAPLPAGARYILGRLAERAALRERGRGPSFTLVFDVPVVALGFDWSDGDSSDSCRLEVGDVVAGFGGAASNAPWVTGFGRAFFGLATDTPFTTLSVISSSSNFIQEDMGWDNPTFASAPAAVPLLGAALGVLAPARRRA